MPARKPLAKFALLLGVLLGVTGPALAGRQAEEPLADAVRGALSAAVADGLPPRLEFAHVEQRLAYLRWLGQASERLKRRKPDFDVRREFLEALWYESRRAGLDPALVLGLVEVESGFRKYAISSAGARGYMQVMPFWARLIGDGDAGRLFHLQANLRFGCVILRHYIDREQGNLFMALGRYNGSRGKPAYPDAVLAARKRWVHPEADLRIATGVAPIPATPATR
ncbi:lytic transglycosylase domain-containing protein [Sphaerotilus mobilis]|uniref:Transglycosylase-like protein with SLT domain n=1 Tax=Sphaerotilus mobilis TaxID=47994 RepID=A0A4Q7LDP0_9BURK|nr:lytic transglycosylase domain-containing protein [Sphaerotilus mobilis]RZS47412.1 transglycosylase-like protein with SLT domain [Sphaerotilus mobilis]